MMHETKLWRAFETLTSTELKQFGWFLDSPYHNQRADTRALFDVLKGFRGANGEVSYEEVWAGVFPKKKFDDPSFRHLCRYLLALLEEFWALNRFRKSDEMRIKVGEAYGVRGLGELGRGVTRKLRRKLQKREGRSAVELLTSFLLEQAHFEVHQRELRSFKPGLQGMSDALDRWYLVQKMKLACAMGSQQRVFKTEYKPGLLGPVLDLVKEEEWQAEPLIAIYASTFEMVHGPETERAYRRQVTLLAEHTDLLTADEQRTLYLMSINFCIRQLNAGAGEFLAEVYQLYKRGLDEGWLFERGQLTP
ncbi:MAG: hypothetical protein AAF570_03995, partial [Bacteroidota bacterium]